MLVEVKVPQLSESVSEAREGVLAPMLAAMAAMTRIGFVCGRVLAAQFDCADINIS